MSSNFAIASLLKKTTVAVQIRYNVSLDFAGPIALELHQSAEAMKSILAKATEKNHGREFEDTPSNVLQMQSASKKG